MTTSATAGLFDSDGLSEDLKLSGFARFIGGYLDEKEASFKGYDDDFTIRPNSLFALQGVYTPIDELSITAQAIARTGEDADSGIEWLYLTYRPFESVQIKAGKLRTPFFALSDVLDVGYAYPWITPPQQVYNAYLFETFEGIDLVYSYENYLFESSIEIYTGRHDGDIDVVGQQTDFSVRNLHGIIGKIQLENFELRVARYAADIDLEDGPLATIKNALSFYGFTQSVESLRTKGKVDANQISLNYDNLNYFFRTELVELETDFEIAPNVKSYYFTAGYNFSTVTTHLTYAVGKNKLGKPAQDIPLGVSPLLDGLAFGYNSIFRAVNQDNLKSWTLGIRWDFRQNLAFKAEATQLKANPGEDGFFTVIDDTNFDRKANLYLIGLEWVF
ncbi:MAG: hypothetical protein ACRBCS_05270 [Cellvibrionaceae bacterium]